MSNEIKQIFIDGIDNINFINGMVRMSMGTIIPKNNEIEDNVEFKTEYRIIMPLNSFLTAFKSQQGLIDKLIENKVLTKEQNDVEVK